MIYNTLKLFKCLDWRLHHVSRVPKYSKRDFCEVTIASFYVFVLLWPFERSSKQRLCVCLVWRWRELIMIELNLRELILVKSEFEVN